jgi:ribose transport system substrate-binding protein
LAKTSRKRLYLIPILSKALDILELLRSEHQPLALETIHQRTHISKTSVYRVLKTFVHRGYLAQSQDGLYRVVSRPKKVRFGFGMESSDMPFSEAVTASLREAAAYSGVDLLVFDNRYDAPTALKNADEFVRNRVELVIEFQIKQDVAPIIADKIAGAGIPMIAVDIPHPHATFFGVDNYRVGHEAGELLGSHAITAWNSRVDWVLGLDLEEAGPLVQSRITGAFEGLRSKLSEVPIECFVRMDARGMRDKSHQIVADFLKRHPKDKHILIAASTDTSALGALQAVRELKREVHVAIVGQDCIPEMEDEMKRSKGPVIGSVSHEAKHYGPRLIQLGLSILSGHTVAPYNYIEHRMVTPASLAALSGVNGSVSSRAGRHAVATVSPPRSTGANQIQQKRDMFSDS